MSDILIEETSTSSVPVDQKKGRNYACSNNKRICKSWIANPQKQGGLFSGNTNQPNFMAVNAYAYSNIINYASRRKATKTIFLSKELNSFGKYQGAPGGSGTKLTNKF